jgi:hypothetical protein
MLKKPGSEGGLISRGLKSFDVVTRTDEAYRETVRQVAYYPAYD